MSSKQFPLSYTTPSYLFRYRTPLLTSICAGLGLVSTSAEAIVYYANTYDNGDFTFDDTDFRYLKDNNFTFTQSSNVNINSNISSSFALIGAKGNNTNVTVSNNSLPEWDFSNLNCSGSYSGVNCSSLFTMETSNFVNFVMVESGAKVTVLSSDPDNRLRINAGSQKISVLYNTEADAINNTSRITLKNIDYTSKHHYGYSLYDQLARNVSTAPAVQKPANAPFNPNFVVENSIIYGLRLAQIVHSDVYLKDTQFLGYIPRDSIPAEAPMPPETQLLDGASCQSCIGIQLIARNGRIVADNIFYRADDGISMVTGLNPSNPAYLDRGNFGTLVLNNSEIITYGRSGDAVQSMTGVRANNPLITKVNIDNSILTTYGPNSYGIWSNYSSGIVKNSTIDTYGTESWGILNDVHGTYTLENTDITTRGLASHGIYAGTVSRGTIPTEIWLQGDLSVTYINSYTGGVALRSTGNGSNLIGIINGTSGVTSGIPAKVEGTNSTFARVAGYLNNPNISTTFRSILGVENAVLTSSGNHSQLFRVVNGGVLEGQKILAQTTGQNGHFLIQQGTTIVYLKESDITLKGADSHFIYSQGKSSTSSAFNSMQPTKNGRSVTESGGIEEDKNLPILGGDLDTKSLTLNKVTVQSEKGMGFVLLGGETNHISITESTIETGTTLSANSRWLVYADNHRTYDASNVLTGSYVTKDILMEAVDSTLKGSVYLKGASQFNNFTLDSSSLIGNVHVLENSLFEKLEIKNNSLWKGATFQDINQHAIRDVSIDASSIWEVYGGQTSHIGSLNNAGAINFNSSIGNFQTVYVDADYTGGVVSS